MAHWIFICCVAIALYTGQEVTGLTYTGQCSATVETCTGDETKVHNSCITTRVDDTTGKDRAICVPNAAQAVEGQWYYPNENDRCTLKECYCWCNKMGYFFTVFLPYALATKREINNTGRRVQLKGRCWCHNEVTSQLNVTPKPLSQCQAEDAILLHNGYTRDLRAANDIYGCGVASRSAAVGQPKCERFTNTCWALPFSFISTTDRVAGVTHAECACRCFQNNYRFAAYQVIHEKCLCTNEPIAPHAAATSTTDCPDTWFSQLSKSERRKSDCCQAANPDTGAPPGIEPPPVGTSSRSSAISGGPPGFPPPPQTTTTEATTTTTTTESTTTTTTTTTTTESTTTTTTTEATTTTTTTEATTTTTKRASVASRSSSFSGLPPSFTTSTTSPPPTTAVVDFFGPGFMVPPLDPFTVNFVFYDPPVEKMPIIYLGPSMPNFDFDLGAPTLPEYEITYLPPEIIYITIDFAEWEPIYGEGPIILDDFSMPALEPWIPAEWGTPDQWGPFNEIPMLPFDWDHSWPSAWDPMPIFTESWPDLPHIFNFF